MDGLVMIIITAIIAILAGLGIGYYIRKSVAEKKITSAEEKSKKILEEAEAEAASLKREKDLEAKEEAHRLRNEVEKENKERKEELQRLEKRLIQKEESLDKKSGFIEKKEDELQKKEEQIEQTQNQVNELYQQQVEELERLSKLSSEEAKELLLEKVKKDVEHEMSLMIKQVEEQAREEADKKSRDIITMAIQRCAAEHTSESTVSVVNLPNDEMKGRIIGREGRNIRSLENLTGIDLIIDDTPGAVIISGFDPIRREIARISLEKLINDGRIHPARIEEMVDKARKEVDEIIREEGERAALKTGIHGLHSELISLLGKLRYRTSYGQNVLQHSIEVSQLAGIMASELGLDNNLAKRAGLLHDIGKAMDQEMEGAHVHIGADLAKKYKESQEVLNAIEAHHGDIDYKTSEAVLIQAADAISASRPGARRESLENYIKRLEKLESVADSFEGVEKCYAIQAGREIRIIVKPEQVNDGTATTIARDIVKRIEGEMEYPGQIKVTVIRETRAVDYAK